MTVAEIRKALEKCEDDEVVLAALEMTEQQKAEAMTEPHFEMLTLSKIYTTVTGPKLLVTR